jgi:endonuclease YncB( thermonuclease family)
MLDYGLMLVFFALVALLAAKLNTPQQPSRSLAGKAYVIDGDTISIAGNHIRLKGIDAPEMAQSCGIASGSTACGQVARQALIRLIAGRPVRCDGYGRDKYERTLATCFIGDINLNRTMVETGQAIAYGDYRDEEAKAREMKKGLWAADFEVPQDWRRDHETVLQTAPPERTNNPARQLFDWIARLTGGLR